MKMSSEKKNFPVPEAILWDFDGVILDSAPIREKGFREALAGFEGWQVERLLDYHRENGGLSRYDKFRYFYKEVLKKSVNQGDVTTLSERFSKVMRELLVDKSLLIEESVAFVKKYYKKIPMFIVSGSDQEELRYLCGQLCIGQYFVRMYGSPTPKIQLVKKVLDETGYSASRVVLIGDSINDYEAARDNNVEFWGYNNERLKNQSTIYLYDFNITLRHNKII